MKVWIVNPFDNTPMEGCRPQRYWLMAGAFRRAGHEVVYWTSDFSHATKSVRRLIAPVDADFRVEMVPTHPYPRNVCLSRVRSHRLLAREWTRRAEASAEKPDMIVASMPPLGLCDAARAYAAKCGALFIADVQDAWPETFERILPRFVLSAMGLRRTARRIYAGSDGVSAVAERYVDLARGYGCRAPCAVFGHCIERRESAAKTDDGVLHLAYIGNMSMSYDLETLVRGVAGMEKVTLDIAGNGPDRARLEALIASTSGAANVRMHPYLGETELARLLDSCDVGVIPMFPDSCVGVPGKMADYAAAGLRVVECLGGETAAIVDRYAVGAHYAAGDTVSLGKAIAAVAKKGKNAGGEDFAGNFDASAVMARYVEWTMALSCGR